MKINFIVLVASACLFCCLHTAEAKPSSNEVVVNVLVTPMPPAEKDRAQYLWDIFANKPDEKKFNVYTTERWRDTYALFAATLLHKAKAKKLNVESLEKVVGLVLRNSRDRIAYLPVGAYQTTLDGNPVWIITVKWEYPPPEGSSTLGHIRMFAFDQKTLRQVAFNTCL